MGASLAVAMKRAGYAVTAVSRRDPAAARSVAERLGGALATDDPQAVVDAVDVVFVTTVDARIEETVRSLAFRPAQVVLHGSGATPLSALDAAHDAGALTGGFHPLQSFPDEHGESSFGGVTFGVEAADNGLLEWLWTLAGALGGRAVRLTASTRAAYHASGTMASSLVSGLVALAAELWRELGLSREEGLEALGPLLLGTSRQITTSGIPGAMTGAFVRGDVETVRRHVGALAGEDVRRAYAALALAQLPIAAEQGNISDEDRAGIEAVLRRALGPVGRATPVSASEGGSGSDDG
jgi:predicted short-subunit dehydrogenase-like oxidoreductase (DUF2520 family)